MTEQVETMHGPAATPEPGDGSGAGPGADAAETELARAREAHTLAQQLEALLIVADEPLSVVALATATEPRPHAPAER